MADWAAIRRLARQRREEVGGDTPSPCADSLLASAFEQTGLTPYPVPPEDPLLAGAHAVLDREALCIWHNADLPPETTRFHLAHELAHWYLHDESTACHEADFAPDPVAEPLPFGQDSVSGYSPAQRREVEANVFAAEFLLPAPLLGDAFLNGQTAEEVAAAVGVSEAAALGQMTEALLGVPVFGCSGVQVLGLPEHRNARTPSLDSSQCAAAEVERGPVLISAGPGTGKTRTLVARVLHLLERGVPAEQILALTFSNKAANEMCERLAAVVPDAARRLWIGTFHAFGLELLRRYGTRLGLPPDPALVDPLDALTLLEQNLARLNLREYEYLHNPAYPFRDMLAAISRAKDELVSPDGYAALAEQMMAAAEDEKSIRAARRAREVAGVYRVWQEILRERGMLDFGDLIARSVELLNEHPGVRAEVQRQYTHVLVDEYQDINRASAVLVKMLAGEGEGLWAVGDLRQAIYRFRGASPANVAQFEEDYPTGRRLSLAVNYRSRPPLVQLFGAAAEKMAETPLSLPRSRDSGRRAGGEGATWTARRPPHTDSIIVAEADDEEAQADGIASAIRRFEADGIPLNEQAILCRTNAQAEALASALEARGVPVLFLGSLFARSEVKDLLALLSLACESSSASLARVARFPEYDLPSDEIDALLAHARENNLPLLTALESAGCRVQSSDAEADVLPSKIQNPKSRVLHAHLSSLAYRGDAYTFLARYLFGEADYLRRLLREDTVASRQSRLALYQLLRLARAHGEKHARTPTEEHPHRAFLAHVRQLVATGEDTRVRLPASAEGIDAVRLMTIHASKGLEFPVVFLPNLAKDLFPSRKPGAIVKPPPGLASDLEESETSEDENLFFVALSRARDHLVLSRPRAVGGKPKTPSPLLALIDDALDACGALRVEWRGVQATRRSGVQETPISEPLNPRTPEPPNAEFSVGAVEQYIRCPRQFYYARVRNLRGPEEASAYGAFQESVWAVIRWAQAEQAAGREIAPDDAMQKLAAQWEETGPRDHPHEPILRERAEAIIAQMSAVRRAGTRLDTEEFVAEFPTGRIRLRVDHAEETPDGGLLVEQFDNGQPADDDHTHPRFAVLRHGMKQKQGRGRPIEIRIRYLTTGETKHVPEQPRWEPNRLAKYEEALGGIQAGEFPAKPSQEQCARCPFFFLCPA